MTNLYACSLHIVDNVPATSLTLVYTGCPNCVVCILLRVQCPHGNYFYGLLCFDLLLSLVFCKLVILCTFWDYTTCLNTLGLHYPSLPVQSLRVLRVLYACYSLTGVRPSFYGGYTPIYARIALYCLISICTMLVHATIQKY